MEAIDSIATSRGVAPAIGGCEVAAIAAFVVSFVIMSFVGRLHHPPASVSAQPTKTTNSLLILDSHSTPTKTAERARPMR